MIYQIKQYIKFLLKSTNQHGVHSPFVYNIVTECFYDKKNYPAYRTLGDYRKSLLKNHTQVNVTDLGAGSHVMKQKERRISSLAINAGTTNKRAQLLYRLSSYFKPKNVLELGTSLGIATSAISLGNPEVHITTIEGCPNISKLALEQFSKLNLKNIHVINGNFKEEIKKLDSNTYDLIFFDGNHQKEATLHYFESLLANTHNDSVFIFDDIYWSKGMTEAWETIKKHPKVSVTIDTFNWGFVFFRQEQVKEHFYIRV